MKQSQEHFALTRVTKTDQFIKEETATYRDRKKEDSNARETPLAVRAPRSP